MDSHELNETKGATQVGRAKLAYEVAMHGTLECDVSVGGSLAHALWWAFLIIITVGIGAMFYPYALAEHVANRTHIVQNGARVGRLQVDVGMFDMIGHALLWFVLAWLTCGVAYIVYLYKVMDFVMDRVRVVPA